MEVWGWIAVSAVSLTLLQLLLYRYFTDGERTPRESRGFIGDDGRDPDVDRRDTGVFDPFTGRSDARGLTGDGTARLCPNCGAENDAEKTFKRCWNCTGLL